MLVPLSADPPGLSSATAGCANKKGTTGGLTNTICGDRDMKRSTIVLLGITAGASALFAASADADQRHRPERFETQLSGLHEDPLVLSTTGSGRFTATLDAAGTTLSYELSYAALEGN